VQEEGQGHSTGWRVLCDRPGRGSLGEGLQETGIESSEQIGDTSGILEFVSLRGEEGGREASWPTNSPRRRRCLMFLSVSVREVLSWRGKHQETSGDDAIRQRKGKGELGLTE
jgi:hypothetical protein